MKDFSHFLEVHDSQVPIPSPDSILENPPAESSLSDSFTFFAIGDWGTPTFEVLEVAKAMDMWSSLDPQNSPRFIIALGDNFYPSGVESVTDPLFKEYWIDVFLCYRSLNVPWMVCLGNHDYMGNPQAQIDFTNHPLNPSGLWRCPSTNYSFSLPLSPNLPSPNSPFVDFFCLDTNGAQFACRKKYPTIAEDLKVYITELSNKLAASTAKWKIVYAHHPLFTKSKQHGTIGKCLRGLKYVDTRGNEFDGYGLEDVLVIWRSACVYFWT